MDFLIYIFITLFIAWIISMLLFNYKAIRVVVCVYPLLRNIYIKYWDHLNLS